jgi:group I intron endonuclease
MFVYLITNKATKQYYVGQTRGTVERRWESHLEAAEDMENSYLPLYRAMRDCGFDNFIVETLCECPDLVSLNSAEKFFIWFLAANVDGFGYNILGGGQPLPNPPWFGKKIPATESKKRFIEQNWTKPFEGKEGFERSLACSTGRSCRGCKFENSKECR